jgi:hypothetical protein
VKREPEGQRRCGPPEVRPKHSSASFLPSSRLTYLLAEVIDVAIDGARPGPERGGEVEHRSEGRRPSAVRFRHPPRACAPKLANAIPGTLLDLKIFAQVHHRATAHLRPNRCKETTNFAGADRMVENSRPTRRGRFVLERDTPRWSGSVSIPTWSPRHLGVRIARGPSSGSGVAPDIMCGVRASSPGPRGSSRPGRPLA